MKICCFVLLLALQFSATAVTAQAKLQLPEGIRRAELAARKQNEEAPPTAPRQTVDLRKLQRDADELAALAESIPPEVEQTTKGMFPKELGLKLKRIEKLAKQLRGQLGH